MIVGWDIEGSDIAGPYETEEAARVACNEGGETQREHRGYFAVELTEVRVDAEA